LYNGRAEISLTRRGDCVVEVASKGIPAVHLKLS
jgi:hypothetical protein